MKAEPTPPTTETQAPPNGVLGAENCSSLPRFYVSADGYIVDSDGMTCVARMKSTPRWKERGDVLCEELSAKPDNLSGILKTWEHHLETNDDYPATS
jgi:hypothetical protein